MHGGRDGHDGRVECVVVGRDVHRQGGERERSGESDRSQDRQDGARGVRSALPAANAAGWNKTDVTVSFTGTDAGSGIDSCSAAVTVSTEGSNVSSSTGTCTDNAGNVSAPVSKTGLKIDRRRRPSRAAGLRRRMRSAGTRLRYG